MPDGLSRDKKRRSIFAMWSHVFFFFNKTIRKIYVEGIGMVYEQSEILDTTRSYFDKNM